MVSARFGPRRLEIGMSNPTRDSRSLGFTATYGSETAGKNDEQ
jgi:hypothetical protein